MGGKGDTPGRAGVSGTGGTSGVGGVGGKGGTGGTPGVGGVGGTGGTGGTPGGGRVVGKVAYYTAPGKFWTTNLVVPGRNWKCHVEDCKGKNIPPNGIPPSNQQAAAVTRHLRYEHAYDIPLSSKTKKRRNNEDEDGVLLVVCVVCMCY